MIVLVASTNRMESLEPLLPKLLTVLETLPPRTLLRVVSRHSPGDTNAVSTAMASSKNRQEFRESAGHDTVNVARVTTRRAA